MLDVRWCVFVGCLFIVCCVLFVVDRSWLLVVCSLLFGCRSLVDGLWLYVVGSRFLVIGHCLLFVVRLPTVVDLLC